MALSQVRPFGAVAGPRYGSFASKSGAGGGGRARAKLAQARPLGAIAGPRFSAFTGKTPDPGGGGSGGAHPVVKITQLRPFGPVAGRRFGAFSGKAASSPPADYTLVAGTGVFTLAGASSESVATLDAAPGAYALTGNPATLRYSGEGPLTDAEMRQMFRWVNELALIHGLVAGSPLNVADSGGTRTAGHISQSIGGTSADYTVSRNP